MPSPNPGGVSTAALGGVSCHRTTSCVAVGDAISGTTEQTLVEQWNGTTWSIVPSPDPAGATISQLLAVACPETTSCFAVGQYGPDSSFKPFVEHWNGVSWSIASIPSLAGARTARLSGVSCPSTTSCFAVGDNGAGEGKSLVEHWDGTRWSIMTSASGAKETDLSGVSCPSTTSCNAVGVVATIQDTVPFAEHWNGSHWAIVPSADPSDSRGVELNGVSCPSVASCFAVGSYYPGPKFARLKTLIEDWNGVSWSRMSSPNATASSTSSYLAGVSCSTTTSCFAVGNIDPEVPHALVERYA